MSYAIYFVMKGQYWSSKHQVGSKISLLGAGLPQALEIMENHQKSSMHGKIMEFEKKLWIIMEKSSNFVK